MAKDNENILSNLRKELESFGPDYKPNTRQAAEMYAQYQPSEMQENFVSYKPESKYETVNGKTEKVIGSADRNKLDVQNQFLSAISSGDRKRAIEIAIGADKSNIGIPISYFNDMLDRDRLMRLAYEQDNQETGKPAIGPSTYNPVPEATQVKQSFPLGSRPEYASMDKLSSSPALREDVKKYQQKNSGIR